MNALLRILALTLISTGLIAQKGSDFDQRFITAKDLLYNFNPEDAIPLLLLLEKEDPGNANIHYLIGACYTDFNPDSDLSVKYLEKARNFVSDKYDADSPKERMASVHLYYFLSVAYAQNHRCDEARDANEKFRTLIGQVGGAYIRDAEFWVNGCYTLAAVKEDAAPAEDVRPGEDPYAIGKASIVTQNIDYTTTSPLYGVQVGSFSKYVPVGSYDDIKNVDAFIDKNGLVRYVVGSFTFRKQAETLMKVLQESGYRDAFIVDVNKEKRFADRIITVNNISIRNDIRGRVHYRCQIGAFRDSIPREMAEKYVKLDGIMENREGDLTLLSVGRFDTYDEAVLYKKELEKAGIFDAFVVAYNFEEKISIKQARSYQEKQKSEQ